MKSIDVYILFVFCLLVASCADQEFENHSSSNLQSSECRFSVSIPAPMEANTRVIGSELTEAYVKGLPMHVLMFDENGFFFAFQEAAVESFTANENGTGGVGTYTVDLPASNTPCALHFVLGYVDDFENPQYTASDSETSIFSQLETSNDVYWQRVEVDNILKDENGQVASLPETIKLVRNYAQVSLEVVEEVTNFHLDGFTIVHESTASTVAPYCGNEAETTNGVFASFDNLSIDNAYASFVERNPGFRGNNAGSLADVDEAGKDIVPNETEYSTEAKYVFERNQDDAGYPAYVLLRGYFGDQQSELTYYKLDIVTRNEIGITSYLNLYRNFHFKITINRVVSEGYDTAQEAMEAVASNNIGASIEASEVNNIRDGINRLYVSTLDTLLVDTKAAKIYYEYRENVNAGNTQGDLANEKVTVIAVDGNSENVLNPFAIDHFEANDGVLTIHPATSLPNTIQEQEFIVTTPSGLMRRIRVRVRQPYRFSVVDCETYTPAVSGSTLNLVVRLPDYMPSSVFPLVLDIEPRRKTLTPYVEENRLPVHLDGQYTYSYLGTVTYEEYRENRAHFFVFRTNTSDSETFITVTNPYFEDESIGYDYTWNDEEWNQGDGHPYNVVKFINSGKRKYRFFDVRLESSGSGRWEPTNNADDRTEKGIYTFDNYNSFNETVTLHFKIHESGDEYTEPHPEIRIFADYLNFDVNQITTSTGAVTGVREDGQCIYYVPNNSLEEQILTFTINTNYARERIQLSSYDHETATVNYTNQDHTVRFRYRSSWDTNNVPQGNNNLRVSTNRNFSDAEYWEVGSNGNVVINPYIIGLSPDTRLYFRYNESIFNYEANMTVQELLGTDNVTLRN